MLFVPALAPFMPGGLAHGLAAPVLPVAAIPSQARLLDYPVLYQQHALSCEAAAASMATKGQLPETAILASMPFNDNPWLGFRGSLDRSETLANDLADYGIYAPPLAREMESFGYQTVVISGSAAREWWTIPRICW
jgi:hypothetical protein